MALFFQGALMQMRNKKADMSLCKGVREGACESLNYSHLSAAPTPEDTARALLRC